jgi:hypothetical protein
MAGDVLNREDVFQAVKGSDIVYLLVGLEYSRKVWKRSWPVIMRNTIDACKATGARLIFFDNVYMYGRVKGKMTEATPFNPCSEKGRIRKEIDEMLLSEMNTGSLKAIIAKAADFYGPRADKTSVAGIMVFDKMKKEAAMVCQCQSAAFIYLYTGCSKSTLRNHRHCIWTKLYLPTYLPAPRGKNLSALRPNIYAENKGRFWKWLVKLVGLVHP